MRFIVRLTDGEHVRIYVGTKRRIGTQRDARLNSSTHLHVKLRYRLVVIIVEDLGDETRVCPFIYHKNFR